ncbi:hypothetical protein [Microbacterium paraoxydans]|uniref:hypothetical protein n=1 Tax=Microbacterium paraoxydans TaxID=199592 RepID=UPI001CF985C4|nr:hypothetical protein [Microbacterium paraoxydans]
MSSPAKTQSGMLSTVLWGLQFAVAGALIAFVYFKRIYIPQCDLQCNFVLLDATGNIFAIFAVLLFVAVGVLQLTLPGPSRWWLPAGGITLTVVGAIVANYVSENALLA